MATRKLEDKIKLASYEDMFDTSTDTNGHDVLSMDGQVSNIPLTELHEFKNHPFHVLDDEKMDETVESVKKYGVLVPGICRKRKEGGYEIISGHRRKHASEIEGLETMPMIIKECSDDEAIVIMVDSNIQREDILPSEKAKAYSMKYEAMKHQGIIGGLSVDTLGEAAGESGKTVQRYIRLSFLIDDLLTLVDEKKVGIAVAVELSFLSEEIQKMLSRHLRIHNNSISLQKAIEMKKLYRDEGLTDLETFMILNEDKEKGRKVTLTPKKLNSYFPANYSAKEIERQIIALLEEWKEKGGEMNNE